jgi:YegS/Rv2252/BmrU family lipid kinase
MKIVVVLNAAAGALLGKPIEATVEATEAALGHPETDVQVFSAAGPNVVPAIEKACASDADVVMVGGGDGTIATAAGMLAGTDKALGILPLGTMNLLAKDLGIPTSLAAAIPALAAGEFRHIDIADVNGRIFLNSSLIGLFPMMVQQRERNRGKMSLSTYFRIGMSALIAISRYRRLGAVLEIDGGERRRVRSLAMAITNNPHSEGFAAFLTRASLDSGELGLYIAKHKTVWSAIRLVAALATGLWRRDPELEMHTARAVTIHTRRGNLWVANDGELHLIETPLQYRIRPGALKVLVPSPPADVAVQEKEAIA